MGADNSVEHVIGPYRITAATAFGPRLLDLSIDGTGDLFARLPADVVIAHVAGDFHFRGGHRLWAGPERPPITYAPDDHACVVTTEVDSLTVEAPPDAAGLIKRLDVSLTDGGLSVDHRLTNGGADELRVAPWAITQFALGGTAILPLGAATDPDALQPDRCLVLWPYTRLTDHRISWSDKSVAIDASPGPRLKLGSGPNPRRLGYLRDGLLFMKEIEAAIGDYPDRGAAGQVFVAEQFCELETVGLLSLLAPGDTAAHRETWQLMPCADLDAAHRLVGGTR